MTFFRERRSGAKTAMPRACHASQRWVWRSMIALVVALVSASGLSRPASATQFLDDFEGDGEVTRIPAPSLRNWSIITSVDLLTESNAPLCRLTGSCIDLVGTAGARTGGVVSKQSFPLGDHVIGFFLYGSGRDRTGAAVPSGGTVSRIQVSFGARSIYANNNIASDFRKFVVLHVRGSGKLKFQGTGEVAGIGPILDNALVLPSGQ
ncbi:MAG: hypothetical protein WAS21_22735 [Geminicoccaceae bacterium]